MAVKLDDGSTVQSIFLTNKIIIDLNSIEAGTLKIDSYQFNTEDKQFLTRLTGQQINKTKVSREKNKIYIEYKSIKATLEFTENRIYLNGKEIVLKPDLSITQSLNNWGKSFSEKKKTSRHENLFNFIVPKSQAILADLFTVALLDAIINGPAASVPVAAPATTASAAVVAGKVVAAVAVAVAGAVYCEGYARWTTPIGSGRADEVLTKNNRRIDCFSKPLSWVGLNPRDALYLTEIECSNDAARIYVSLQTPNDKSLSRELNFNGENLISVEEGHRYNFSADDIKENRSKTLTSDKELAAFKEDARYYRKICADPKAQAELKIKTIEARNKKGQPYREQPKAQPTVITK